MHVCCVYMGVCPLLASTKAMTQHVCPCLHLYVHMCSCVCVGGAHVCLCTPDTRVHVFLFPHAHTC